MSDWNKRFLELAYHVAGWSKDPRTKVGAVIAASDHRVVALGYNGFPRRVGDDDHRYKNADLKYRFIVHAEANALLNTNRSPENCDLYTLKHPCTECTKLIIQAGIARVFVPKPDLDDPSYKRWLEDMKISTIMLLEAGIPLIEVEP